MPMIKLTMPTGALTGDVRRDLLNQLGTTLLKWEGAPDTAFFRSITWTQVDELGDGGFVALGDDAPRYRVDVTVPEGALSQRRREGLITETTGLVLAAAGLTENDGLRVWVLVHEQPEGTWGAGGNIVRVKELGELARAERADA